MVDYKITKDDVKWLRLYLGNPSPSGNEINGQKLWLEYIKPFIDDYVTDHYGNVAAIINPDSDYRVVLEAHADEIAWYVHTITSEGFLHVKKKRWDRSWHCSFSTCEDSHGIWGYKSDFRLAGDSYAKRK